MAKQTFTTGQVLTAAQMTSLQQTAMLGGAASAKIASYVLVAADAGDAITMSNAGATTITANTGLFAAGDIVTIINLGAGVCTITAGTATVSTSGSLALAQNQGGVLRFTSASAAIFLQFATPASGDIEGVTAGTGISGGGTSGTVTVTNSMATAMTTKGDLVVATGSGTFVRQGVGANNQVLMADSVEADGVKYANEATATLTTTGDTLYASAANTLARRAIGSTGQVLTVSGGLPTWATPSSGSWTQAATGSLGTGTSVTISSLTGQKYYVYCHGWSSNGTQPILIRLNGDTGANYYRGDSSGAMNELAMFGSVGQPAGATLYHGCLIDMANTSMTYKPVISTNGTDTTNGSVGGWYNSTSTITSITLFPNGANWDAGTYYVWSFA